jgi:putative transcriptional regulator
MLLAERNLNYTRLSEMTGIAISTLSRFGSGETKEITYATLDKICEALNCQVGDLLVWEYYRQESKMTQQK